MPTLFSLLVFFPLFSSSFVHTHTHTLHTLFTVHTTMLFLRIYLSWSMYIWNTYAKIVSKLSRIRIPFKLYHHNYYQLPAPHHNSPLSTLQTHNSNCKLNFWPSETFDHTSIKHSTTNTHINTKHKYSLYSFVSSCFEVLQHKKQTKLCKI